MLRDTLHAEMFPPLASCKHLTYPPSPNLPSSSIVTNSCRGLSDFRLSGSYVLAPLPSTIKMPTDGMTAITVRTPIRLGVETMHIAAPNGDHGSTPNGGSKIDGRQCSIQDDIHQNEFLLKRAYRAGWTEDIVLTKDSNCCIWKRG
ncbi:hypothetical protein MHU86_25005 [Fragilaria crotonensis]|nr:hypothetical protein MHU86_25005 [Fragilaria crotonensis]